MPDFVPHHLKLADCRREVLRLKRLLDKSADLGEAELRKVLKGSAHLRALVGRYNTDIINPDRVAWEYPLFGSFRCDFAVGDSARGAYAFVECEDARPNSLFVAQGKRLDRTWSPRFDGGYGQVIDWFYKLQVMTDTPDMEARFGKRTIRYTGVLVIGRHQHMSDAERLRLEWRREHLVVNSKKVVCITYDQLVDDCLFRLAEYAKGGGRGQ
jgi:hypothetical protein